MYNKDNFFRIISTFNISNKELATAIDVSPGNIGDWKSGRSKPNIDAVVKIADYLDICTDKLLGRDCKKQDQTILHYSGDNQTKKELHETMQYILNNIEDENMLIQIKMFLETYKK